MTLGLALSVPAAAQQVGHYLQGVSGVGGGSLAPSGIYGGYLPYVNNVHSVRDRNGDAVLEDLDFRIAIHNIVSMGVTRKRILGARYGASVVIPFAKQRLESDLIPSGSASSAGLSDVFFQPVMLGWEKGRADILATYGFYAPTGDYDPARLANPGLGFWENQFQLGTTYYFNDSRTVSGSLLTTWEVNRQKDGIDLTPGPMLTAEYGLGATLLKGGLKLGAAGYYYRKLIPDSGVDANPLQPNDQAFGLGPEIGLTLPIGLPSTYASFLFRYQPQFGVRARTQGNVLILSVTLLKLFP